MKSASATTRWRRAGGRDADKCAGVWILRRKRPELQRAFRVPAVPFVSTASILVCGSMIYGLGWTNWMRLIVWLVIGLVFYFSYGISHSRLQAQSQAVGG